MSDNDKLWQVLTRLPSDYKDYGGEVERWKEVEGYYPDCSCGCIFWKPLHDTENNKEDFDWGVCVNPNGPRKGLLTWEHQAGVGCFK
jgi:hypothetical protein